MSPANSPSPPPSLRRVQGKPLAAAAPTAKTPVALDRRAARAWPFLLGIAYAEPGTVLVGPCGETLIVREDGGADPWPPFGYRSIASDPTAGSGGVRPVCKEEVLDVR